MDLRADNAWLADGWARDVRLACDTNGRFAASVAPDASVANARWALPGIANLHSHAFQRAMAGLAERQASALVREREHQEAAIPGRTSQQTGDSFWTWRETMYGFAATITPEDLHAIAAQLYVEMLQSGYTHVCEFHYLHHAPDGKPYADPAAMSRALIAAARETGIGMTLLPVLYMRGGFDGRALSSHERDVSDDRDFSRHVRLAKP